MVRGSYRRISKSYNTAPLFRQRLVVSKTYVGFPRNPRSIKACFKVPLIPGAGPSSASSDNPSSWTGDLSRLWKVYLTRAKMKSASCTKIWYANEITWFRKLKNCRKMASGIICTSLTGKRLKNKWTREKRNRIKRELLLHLIKTLLCSSGH